MVKQYGRRLVLDLGVPFDLETERGRFGGVFKSVQSVETDFLVMVDQLLVSDSLIVSVLQTANSTNGTEPDLSGAYVDPATQTPLWNLMDSEPYSIHAEGVWQVTNSTPDVVVAIIDTGMAELAKPMFLNLLDGYDFITDDGLSIDGDGRDPDSTDPGDWSDMCPVPSWHGTKVASILAARHDNAFGMKGVAQNCSVLPVRVLGLCRMGYASDVSDAIVWAAGGTINGVPSNPNIAKIISLSLAGQGSCPAYLQSAIDQAIALGSIVVAAAGNNNQNVSGYFPANCKGVIAVAASTREGKLAGYSNWGDLIDLSAPGGDYTNAIMTLGVNELETGLEVFFGMGTSFAVPHVTGIGALVHTISGVYPDFENLILSQNNKTLNLTCIGSSSSCTNKPISLDIYKRIYAQAGGLTLDSWSYCDTSPPIFCNGNCIDFGDWSYDGYYIYHATRQINCEWYSAYDFVCDLQETCQSLSHCNNLGGKTFIGDNIFTSRLCCTACDSSSYTSGCTQTSYGTCAACSSRTCSAGQYLYGCGGTSAGSCGACSGNNYCPGGASPPVAWKTCTAGTYQTTAPTASNDRTCSNCPTGKYSATINAVSSATCVNCPVGTYSSTAGASACSFCNRVCSSGQYITGCSLSSSGSCATCAASTYRSIPAAYSWAPFKWTAVQAFTDPNPTFNFIPSNCRFYAMYGNQPGYVCPYNEGFFVWWYNNRWYGSYWSWYFGTSSYHVLGPSLPSNDLSVGFAPIGALLPTITVLEQCSACAVCAVGSYKSTECTSSADTVCIACVATKFCPLGSTSQSPCPAGNFCPDPSTKTLCTSGSYCPAGVIVQTICALGSYCTNTSTQQACVSPNYCAAGSTSQTPCPAGFYCSNPSTKITCPQNSYCPAGSITQILCPAGSRGAAIGSSSASNCIPCLAGTYSSTQGSIICTNCTKGSNYSLSSATACTTCSPTPPCVSPTFIQSCTTTSNTMCAECNSENLPQNAQWMDNIVDDCVWACDRTSPGYFKVSNTCQACKIPSSCVTGNYVTTCNATADGVCNPCNNKPLNSFYTSASISYDQSGCEWSCNGGFSKGASTCDACGMGTYSLQGDDLCSICPAGKYTPSAGYSVCSVCQPGTFSPTPSVFSIVGAVSCTNCTAGTYSHTESAAACLPCSSTSYTPTIGATSCTPCPLCTVTGDFRSGCSGTSPGTCDKCINPT